MAKTVTAMLIGTEYGGTSLRHLLEMSPGVRFVENYSGRDDVARLFADRIVGPASRVRPIGGD